MRRERHGFLYLMWRWALDNPMSTYTKKKEYPESKKINKNIQIAQNKTRNMEDETEDIIK